MSPTTRQPSRPSISREDEITPPRGVPSKIRLLAAESRLREDPALATALFDAFCIIDDQQRDMRDRVSALEAQGDVVARVTKIEQDLAQGAAFKDDWKKFAKEVTKGVMILALGALLLAYSQRISCTPPPSQPTHIEVKP